MKVSGGFVSYPAACFHTAGFPFQPVLFAVRRTPFSIISILNAPEVCY